MQAATWVDGVRTEALPLPDRAMEFGDGLFETLLLHHGSPLFTDLHLQRLQCGLQVLAFPDCLAKAREQLLNASAVVCNLGWRWAALRLTISRGSGPRGYAPPAATRPRIIITASELSYDCQQMGAAAVLSLANVRWPTQPALAGLKHLNRLEQVLAAAERCAAGTDEAVMLGQSGQLVSVVAGNLFLVRGGTLQTPALVDCGIAGTRRRLVMERWAGTLGLPVRETTLSLQDLEAADEVFYCNSLLGLRPVSRFGQRHWSSHAICEALFEQYQGEFL
ncbi:MAG: aminodeoxychorismate lyase [Gammaproteobacteria bacterium]|nr:MAG: aminodeoxychorismate lyase [Gammaproteobacteria bacterium]RLA61751.1 MAG: aminodeoxychorismate lyase [Gammaproteobacteria bacterium]